MTDSNEQKTLYDKNSGATSDDLKWTCVLAVKDTDEEYELLFKSLPSALRLRPDEMIVCLDEPVSQRLVDRILMIQEQHGHQDLRILSVAKTPEWNFTLANIIWQAYTSAKYDRILSFDVDCVLTKKVLLGLPQIGKDNVAIVSFTQRLKLKTVSDLIRNITYRIWVRRNDYVFTGVYWVWRPYFFDTISLEEYMKISNGIDTILTEETRKQERYRIITRKEIGAKGMRVANEGLPWRQFQVGVWLAAQHMKWRAVLRERREIMWREPIKTWRRRVRVIVTKLLHAKYWDIDKRPRTSVYIHSVLWQYPYIFKGYRWAMANPDAEVVQLAKRMSLAKFETLGSKYFNNIMDWKVKGTGYIGS